jgi:hypothetical protein
MILAVKWGWILGLFAAILEPVIAVRATAAEYFVSPRGRIAGRGTRFDPWDLGTALSGKTSLRPGDTLLLLGGVYRGQFTSRLRGSEGKPITIRPASGQRVTIDCRDEGKSNGDFFIQGAWCVFRDLEVTCSDRRRQTQLPGSSPGDIHRGGIFCQGSHIKLVNLVVHDVASGIGFWSQGEGGEIYGCLIFNNGWMGPDRGHGHGIYAQNETGSKTISDNIIFNQFGGGIHCYGSSQATLNNFRLEGNVCFNNGCQGAPEERTRGILCGGGCPVRGARVVENIVYSDRFNRALELGFYDARASNFDAEVRDNYVVGSLHIINFEHITFSGNTVVGEHPLVELRLEEDEDTSDYQWNQNRFFAQESNARPFRHVRGDEIHHHDFARWQESTGFDRDSEYHDQHAGCEVRVRPNKYQPGRAHVVVINWDNKQEVDVDLSDVLPPEQAFRVVSAQDFFGEPVIRSTYRGGSVRFPLHPVPPQPALAWEDHALPVTEPQFAVFVVLPE